ncbi:MAG TPA: hypothetical protein VHF90_08805 [Thermoleophilaceae bacterium]|nr:hypothetical protein [Thermoleophilaceae bacterium]
MSSFAKVGLGALVALIGVAVSAATASAVNVKYIYAQNAQVGHVAGDPYTGPQNGTLSSATAEFETAGGTISCNESTMNGEVNDSGIGDGVPNGTVDVLTFSSNGGGACTSNYLGNPNCSVTPENLPWNFNVSAPSTTAFFNVSGAEVTVNCGFGDCTYGIATLVGTISWNPAGIAFNNSVPHTAGANCPANGTLQVVYSVTGEDDAGGAIGIQVTAF